MLPLHVQNVRKGYVAAQKEGSFRIKILNINQFDVQCYPKTEMNQGTNTCGKYISDLEVADNLVPLLFSAIHITLIHTQKVTGSLFPHLSL